MNYSKLVLVGLISAFVAILTSVLGVAGTIIGSVISSVLYNMLSEALEKPVQNATFSTNFEWEIAYIFPLVVIVLIQLLLIFAMLSEMGLLPTTFLNAFLSLQHFANNNLYRILGVALLVMSVYPLILKPDVIKKFHGALIAAVGLIFLARGFVDMDNSLTDIYDGLFVHFDLPIAIIALIILIYVIIKILVSTRESEREFKNIKHNMNEETFSTENIHKVHHSRKHDDFNYIQKRQEIRQRHHNVIKKHEEIAFDKSLSKNEPQKGINESSSNIHFESNDLLDDYKK